MLSIKKYNKKLINEWNKFVHDANNGNLFHNQHFLNYHIDRSFLDSSLMFYKSNKIIALLPGAIQMINKKKILCSHPGASYGGIIIKQNLSFETINNILNALDVFCIKNNFDSILLINAPIIYYNQFDESLNYLLLWNNYVIKEQYISHVADLGLVQNVKKLLTKRKQRYINNSADFKQFQFVESEKFNEFYNLLADLKKKYNAKPTHSLDELKKIKKLFPKKCMLFLSFLNSNIIGGTLMFFMNKKISLVFYNVVANDYRNTQLSMYQLYNCMKVAKKGGYRLIDFGVSQTPEQSNPLSPKLSLIKFKEHFGAFGTMRTIYKKEFDND